MQQATPKLLSVEAWIEAHYGDGAPSVKTVRRWIRGGYIIPAPEKHGRAYYVRSDARYVDPANPQPDVKPSGRTSPFLERVKSGLAASDMKPRRRPA